MNMQDLKQSEQDITQALEAYQRKDFEGAQRLLNAALKVQDKRADAWTLMGMVLRQQGQIDMARQAHLHAIGLQADYASAYNNLANLEREADRIDDAVRLYRKASTLSPKDASLWGNLGSALALLGRHAQAETSLRQAIGVDADAADAHWDLALALLNQGQFAQAFQEYEWRFARKQPERPPYTQPVWQGEALDGTLLLYAEQGYGDCIQYLRFLPHIVQRVKHIQLFVHPPLEALIKSFQLPQVEVITALPSTGDFVAHASLLSLPALIDHAAQLLGQTGVYLAVNNKKSAQWCERMNAHPELKAGLVWAGNPNVKNDRLRSPRLQALLPLLDVEGVRWFSLQKGDGLKDLQHSPVPSNFHVLDEYLQDFMDTACAINAMDLVITSDTSVAHLAGALGKRTWVINPAVADWRWVGDLNTSWWYLNAKVYKAHARYQWSAVVACMREDLQALIQHRKDSGNLLQTTLALYGQGRLPEAWDLVQACLDVNSMRTDVWNLAAVLAKNLGATRWAEMAFHHALKLDAAFPDARRNLAHLLKAQKRFDEALVHYRKVCEQVPEQSDLWVDLSDCLRNCDQLQEARKAAGRAVAMKLDSADAWNILGAACTQLEEHRQARECFQVASTLNPTLVEAHYNLGVNFHHEGQPKQAMACFESALGLNPAHCSARYNLGSCLQELGRHADAETAFRQALQIKPDHFASLFSLAAMCHFSGKFREAWELEKRCMSMQPEMLAMQVDMHYLALKIGNWSEIPALPELMDKLFAHDRLDEPPPPFSLMVLPTPMTEAQQLKIARAWSAVKGKNISPLPPRGKDPAAGKTRRLRIGYASSDFHNHATMHLMRGLFPAHDRQQFEIFAYSWGPDDKSSYRKQAQSSIERFRDLQGQTAAEIARQIAQDGIDILIDLKGHTRDSRIEVFQYRPAPVQAQYIGYPGSLGTDCMDYIITDRIVTPPEQQPFYTETFAYLPHCYQVNDQDQAIDTTVPDRLDAGLPEQAFVFACFCSHYKIDPFVFAAWMRILQATPGSVLWLLSGPDSVMDNFRQHARQAGIDPQRLVFGPIMAKPRHLARLGLADLFLDTRWYNAHTTASDALWAGVPVLTCPGQTFAQRVGASLVNAIEMPELIAKDWDHYEQMAVAIAQKPRQAAQLKMKLAEKRNSAPLFQTARFVKDLESLYLRMWRGEIEPHPTGAGAASGSP